MGQDNCQEFPRKTISHFDMSDWPNININVRELVWTGRFETHFTKSVSNLILQECLLEFVHLMSL